MAAGDPVGTAFIESNTYNEFQRQLHEMDVTTKPEICPICIGRGKLPVQGQQDQECWECDGSGKIREKIPSRFNTEIRKTSWSTHIPCPLARSEESDFHVYMASSKMDYLLYTYLVASLPNVRVVKDMIGKVEICWCKNTFHNIIINGNLSYDKKGAGQLPESWLDSHAQFFMKCGAGKANGYYFMNGNTPFLQNWARELPAYPIACPQPWYYAESHHLAIPLFLCSMSTVTHRYRFRRRICDLLRMRVRQEADDNSPWIYIKCNPQFLQKIELDTLLEPPVMWGRYSKITDEEREWHITWTHRVLATNVLVFQTDNPKPSGERVTLPIHTNTPVRALYWVGENQLAREIGNRSNYTTDAYDSNNGWAPITRVAHRYQKKIVLEQTALQSGFIEPWYHGNSLPRTLGYHMYAKSYQPGILAADVGLVYAQGVDAELTFTINSGNPLLREGESNNINDEDARNKALMNTVTQASIRTVGKDEHFYIKLFAYTFNVITFSHGHYVVVDDGSNLGSAVDGVIPVGNHSS